MKLKNRKGGIKDPIAIEMGSRRSIMVPNKAIAYAIKHLMTPKDRFNLMLLSRESKRASFNNAEIMKYIQPTFLKNDAVTRNFIRIHGKKLQKISVSVDRGAFQFLKDMLPFTPNVEHLTINLSEKEAEKWAEKQIQPLPNLINLPNLKTIEVYKPEDLKVIMSLAKDSIKKVKYVTEKCDLTAIAEYLQSVESLECKYPTAMLLANQLPAALRGPTPAVLIIDSIKTIKIETLHCATFRDAEISNLISIEINKLARTDDYLRRVFQKFIKVEHVKINSAHRDDILDIVGEIPLLPSLKTFSLEQGELFSIYVNAEDQQIAVSDHIRENCEKIMQGLRRGFLWYQGE